VQICLDYYRILGLPIQTSSDRIELAYRDRSQQLPQHEYSEAALVSRQALLSEACEILSNPKQRLAYDTLILKTIRTSATPEKSETENSVSSEDTELTEPPKELYAPLTLDITSDKFLGALLILYELGEYQQILQLVHPYLEKSPVSFNLESDELSLSPAESRDAILATALSYLEIGREEWQKREYQRAAQKLTEGRDLLVRENLFGSLAQEIQTEIYKLRPYRILHLLSLEEDKVAERMQGLQMLREMLDARGGINGTLNDRSGLRTEDFLRFIQQIRVYLTTIEQQALFELESRRPSEVARYLAACTSIARGFDLKQPDLIVKAKEILLKLSQRRDVHLERAICALLLRQIEEAGRAIELSSDEEAVNAIREKSQNAPDLLPGLCDYTQEWLDKEIFPYFRDLIGKRAALKPYFFDEKVEDYVNELESNPNSSRQTLPESEILDPSVETLPVEVASGNIYDSEYEEDSDRTTGSRSAPNRGNLTSEIVSPSREGETSFTQSPGLRRRELRRRESRQSFNLKPILWGLMGLGILGVGVAWAKSWQTSNATVPNLESDQLLVRLNRSPVEIPTSTPTPIESPTTTSATETLTTDTAQEVVQTWLDTKAKARGKERQIDQLANILTQPALNDQKTRAEGDRQSNSYWQYEHSFSIKSVRLDPQRSDRATINASVTEKAQLYQGSKPKRSGSRNDELSVSYGVIKQGDRWLIREIKVVD
jgi:curved DNA-binding protein CbpA